MSMKHLRLAEAPICFTETECLDCEQVVAVGWQHLHHNMALPSSPVLPLTQCPMCGGGAVRTRVVDKTAFEFVTKAWDLLAIGDDAEAPKAKMRAEEDNVIDLSDLFKADDE